MSANSITSGSKYECKHNHRSVQIWVQTSSQNGLNMSANFNIRGSKYECKHRMFLLTRFVQKWGLEIPSAILNFLMFAIIFGPNCDNVCTHIWTHLLWSLHSYMDRPVMKFALIFGPTCKKVCTHNWTTPIIWWLNLRISYIFILFFIFMRNGIL